MSSMTTFTKNMQAELQAWATTQPEPQAQSTPVASYPAGTAPVKQNEEGNVVLVGDEDKKARSALMAQEVNFIGQETQKLLRTKKYVVPIAKAYLKELQNAEAKESKPKPCPNENSVVVEEPVQDMEVDVDAQQPQSEKPTIEEIIETRTGR
ncbi:hypothetical protein K443DRAFT_8992 [Laccaria amethystina LaAM-08-1]|uniref:Uncharacterized protein n=1 Tax=Laccaria amethystina LaAM-08-1 TaxID=1095629 RepID=A0A0C9XAY7_9AGAR|nr:hypothetical protein K443DRAFT_8992 [Laccaria amethystina LaAM-08-1]